MGVLGKLAFWRKTNQKAQAGAVEPFVASEAQSPKGEDVKADLSASVERAGGANPQDDEADNNCPPAPAGFSPTAPQAPPHIAAPPSASVSGRPSPSASSSSRISPPLPKGAPLVNDADALEAELDAEEDRFPTPKLPEVADPCDEELDLELPIEQVYAGVSQAFGPMIASSLQSPKWDKRAQALKAVGTMLRGLDLQGMAPPGSTGVLGKGLRLRDRVLCWRSCCQLLHHVMCDKVMPVRLASHELFQDAFGNAEGLVSQEECHRVLHILFKHVIDRLGDSNVRLHESARKCVFFVAERPNMLGLEATLGRLQERLSSCSRNDRQKVYNGVLDAVNFLLQHFPGRRSSARTLDDDDDEEEADSATAPTGSWTQHDIAPFIAAGMDDTLGPRVRSTVIALAVTVYQTFGMEAMQPVLDGLRPAKQALLRQKFQESEDMDPEEFQRNTACGTTASTMATPSEGVTRTDAFNDLKLSGHAVKIGGGKHPMLPGSLEDPDEEDLMDGILEEAGLVFNGSGIVNEGFGHDSRCLRPVPGLSRTLLEDDLEEEHRILEEELMRLDIELDDIAEQEALLGDCAGNRGGSRNRPDVILEVC